MSSNPNRMLIMLTALTGFLVGCGGGSELPEYSEKLVSVSGQVKANGKPLSHATVTFIPQSGDGQMASGKTDDQGNYELFTHMPNATVDESRGAVPGEYKVTVSRISMPDGSPVPEGTSEADAMGMDAKETVPRTFSDPEKTRLTATVQPNQDAPINLELPK